MIPSPPGSTLFPYTTLFRSHRVLIFHAYFNDLRLINPCYLYLTSEDRKSTRLNSSHVSISYAVFCLKKKNAEGISSSTTLSFRVSMPFFCCSRSAPWKFFGA